MHQNHHVCTVLGHPIFSHFDYREERHMYQYIIIIMKEFIVRLLQCGHEQRCITLYICIDSQYCRGTDQYRAS